MADIKLDCSKLSDEDIQDLFTDVFAERVGSYNNIDEFECTCKREVAGSEIMMEVLVVGFAGSPTKEDFESGNLENADSIVISREDKGSLKFVFAPEETLIVNGSDYIVIYKSE